MQIDLFLGYWLDFSYLYGASTVEISVKKDCDPNFVSPVGVFTASTDQLRATADALKALADYTDAMSAYLPEITPEAD